MTRIRIVDTVDQQLLDALQRLIPQLSSTAAIPSAELLQRIISSPDTALFVAENQGRIIGTLTLAFYAIPTGVKAWIEDVVVDAEARGLGAGKALVSEAVAYAKANGAASVSLTSNPSRTAARKLYTECSFTQPETTLFRVKF